MRKKELANANDELFRRNDDLLRKIEELKKQITDLQSENQRLVSENEGLISKLNATKPLKDLENKITSRAAVSKETDYAASVIGKIVVKGTKHCNALAALPENAITKEQINLILGRTEVAKAEILKITENDMSFEEKKAAIDSKKTEAEEYFISVMAQSV